MCLSFRTNLTLEPPRTRHPKRFSREGAGSCGQLGESPCHWAGDFGSETWVEAPRMAAWALLLLDIAYAVIFLFPFSIVRFDQLMLSCWTNTGRICRLGDGVSGRLELSFSMSFFRVPCWACSGCEGLAVPGFGETLGLVFAYMWLELRSRRESVDEGCGKLGMVY